MVTRAMSHSMKNEAMEYDATVFLSPPRSNKKKLGGVLNRRSTIIKGTSQQSPTFGSPMRQETKRFAGLFVRKDPHEAGPGTNDPDDEADDTDDEPPINLGALLSPRLEQKLTKRKQFSFPSLKAFRSPLQSGGRRAKSVGSLPLHRGNRHDFSSGDDESEASNEEENDTEDEDVEKLATSDDLLLLLCRELELMSDGEDDGGTR